MTTRNNKTNKPNNLYIRIAIILLAANFILNGYCVYSLLKINEMNQNSVSIDKPRSVKK